MAQVVVERGGRWGGRGASAVACRVPREPPPRSARSYAVRLAARSEVPVYLVDERLTTVSAGAALRAGGHDSRSARRVVDQAAATALLQGVLDAAAARGARLREPCWTVGSASESSRATQAEDSDEGDRT